MLNVKNIVNDIGSTIVGLCVGVVLPLTEFVYTGVASYITLAIGVLVAILGALTDLVRSTQEGIDSIVKVFNDKPTLSEEPVKTVADEEFDVLPVWVNTPPQPTVEDIEKARIDKDVAEFMDAVNKFTGIDYLIEEVEDVKPIPPKPKRKYKSPRKPRTLKPKTEK
jgi:hypothetical protein